MKTEDTILYDIKKEFRRRKRKERIEKGCQFVKENWVWISALGATGIGVAKKVMNTYNTHAEIKFKERTIYDRSLGRYVELKKPLNARQALEIEERRANGEKLHMILNDMKLLKR